MLATGGSTGCTCQPETTSSHCSPFLRLANLPSSKHNCPMSNSLAASAFLPHTSQGTSVGYVAPSYPCSLSTKTNDAHGVPLCAYFTVTPFLLIVPHNSTLLRQPIGVIPSPRARGNHFRKRPHARQFARAACGPLPGLMVGMSTTPQWGQTSGVIDRPAPHRRGDRKSTRL